MRIEFNINLAPIAEQDGSTKALLATGQAPAQVFALQLGLTPSFMVYDGTIGRARVWSNDDGSFRAANALDWTRETANCDPTKPTFSFSVAQCGRLALRAQTYWPAAAGLADPMLPVMLDLEAAFWSTRLPAAPSGIAVAQVGALESDEAFYDRILGQLGGALWTVGVGCGSNTVPNVEGNQERTRVGVYGWPDPWMTRNFTPAQLEAMAGWQKYLRWCDVFCPSLYLSPDQMSDRGWFDWASKVLRDAHFHAPWMPVLPALCPLYQQRGDQLYASRAKLDGTEIAPMQWRSMLQLLREEGCDGAHIWLPPLSTVTPQLARLLCIAAEFAQEKNS